MTATSSIAPLVKTATVPCPPERAFDLFTQQISAWWPLATHSVGLSPDCRVEMDGRVGGHITETLPDGATTSWGTLTAWEPPSRVAFTWHPGRDPDEATEVQVVFKPAADSGTVVTLVHGGWSARPDGAAARRNYEAGWDPVLTRLRSAAGVPTR
ncbi:MAG TPA: SRPBCC family protein [Candidatus Limnocylindrales bacterium]